MANYVSKHPGSKIDEAVDAFLAAKGVTYVKTVNGAAPDENGNVTVKVSSDVSIDATLTQEGAAADAKAVGEAVNQLSEEIAQKTVVREKPLVYIDGNIPITKDNVLAEMRILSNWLNIHAYIKIKCQGSSSMNYPKKNFTVTLYKDADRTIPLEITIPGWKHPSNKFVLKANYIDHLHARNVVTARLWSEVVASRHDYVALPAELRNSPNNGAVDGFPVIVYANGSYQGLYTWNIGKDDWLWGMDEDDPNHVLLCGETNTDGEYRETACNFRTVWNGVDGNDWSVEVGKNSDEVKNALNALILCVRDTTDEEFRQQIRNHLDLDSAIDYYIFACAICGIDNLGKNMLLGTYNLRKWIMGMYDLDSTWGLWWNGTRFISPLTRCPSQYQEQFSLLFERIAALYAPNIQARAVELRQTVLSYANIVSHFERFAAEIGVEAYADDLVPYPNIPSKSENNLWQIREFVRSRLAYFDVWATGKESGILYSLPNINFSAGESRVMITNGNHVKIDMATAEVYADLTNGQASDTYGVIKYHSKLFELKAGDVVTRKLTGMKADGEFASIHKAMNIFLIAESGEVQFGNNFNVESLPTTHEISINVEEDINVSGLGMWCGIENTGIVNGTVEFDVELYVNGARYI